jgi:hypothetical protein
VSKKRKMKIQKAALKKSIAAKEETLRIVIEGKKDNQIDLETKRRLLNAKKSDYQNLYDKFLKSDSTSKDILKNKLKDLDSEIAFLEQRIVISENDYKERKENEHANQFELDLLKSELEKLQDGRSDGFVQKVIAFYKKFAISKKRTAEELSKIKDAKEFAFNSGSDEDGDTSEYESKLEKDREAYQNAAAAGASKEELEQQKNRY